MIKERISSYSLPLFYCCSGTAAAAAMQLQLQQDTQGDVCNCSNNNKGTLRYLIYDNL